MTAAGDLLVDFPPALRDAAVVDEAGVERLAVELKGARRGVVVVGSSISGLVLASRLSRAEGVTVVLVPGSPPIRRRLVAGCSLRWSTIRRMAAGIGSTAGQLHERLGGAPASFRWLAVERAAPGAGLRFKRRRGTWAPAINVDGMLAAAVGADVFADAFLLANGSPLDAARKALAVTDRSLLGIRTRNRLTQFTFFLAPEANRALTARLPQRAWQLFVDDWVRLGG